MSTRIVAASAIGALAVAGAIVLLTGAGSEAPSPAPAGEQRRRPIRVTVGRHRAGVRVGCARRSEANFPAAFTDRRNLVVGPLVLIGGAFTPPSVVREYGGNKFPLLVKAGHTVTLHVPRRVAGLAYAGLGDGPLPQGQQVRLRDTAPTMTFVACRSGTPPRTYQSNGPSSSYADREQVTFWSGSVVTGAPACVPLAVYVDDEHAPRRVGLALGQHCESR